MDRAEVSSDSHDASSGDAADKAFSILGKGAAGALGLVLIVVGLAVFQLAWPSLREFGARFVVSTSWNPVRGDYGAVPFLWGTAVSAVVALAIALPVGIGSALFMTDMGPAAARRPVALFFEILASVPSVVYGLWGALVVAPWLRETLEPALARGFGFLPLFRGPPLGVGVLCASVVLAIMVLPTVALLSREVLRAVPSDLREGGLALGATRWDVVRHIVLPHARPGLVGASLLGLARVVGEAIAVSMVVGSRPEIFTSLFSPGYTVSSVIANEFAEATSTLHIAALAELGLVLFGITLVFNVAARVLVARVASTESRPYDEEALP